MLAIKDRPADTRDRRDAHMNLRLPRQTRELIDEAAIASGQTLTEFVVASARNHAIDVLLDQRFFALDAEQTERFLDILDNPPPPNEKLRALMSRKAPWEK
jgi:uncharacterized protein (DUF1778 family)